jgi:prepilin-type processing-associated H-X9-DG protein
MAIISLMLSLALPAIGRSRAAARKVECANNLRNIALAMTQYVDLYERFPASGNYWPSGPKSTNHHHSWAVSILPWIGQKDLYSRWDINRPITDPINEPLTHTYVPILVCPVDISRSREKDQGDLSYVVNGGVGFTIGPRFGYEDCPVAPAAGPLDLNGDGSACTGAPGDAEDYAYFKKMGLFFLENWKTGVDRHHRLADVTDGLTQTFMVSENVRAGYDPDTPETGFANPHPWRCSFYIGNPCRGGSCSPGNVDYSLSNAGDAQINSGRWRAEGRSAVPNSFHDGGVNMAYADGRVRFLSESVDGAIYAALASPQGMGLSGPLQQPIVSGGEL